MCVLSKTKNMLGEMKIFKQTNWDFTNKLSNILAIIKAQFLQ